MSKCDLLGHDWHGTAAHGWYQCGRAVGLKASRRKGSRLNDLVYCHAVGHCPGCLGYRLEEAILVWCEVHLQTCGEADFPVVSSPRTVSRSSQSTDQMSFW